MEAMRIKVEACWGGHENHCFRLTLPDGRRESVRGNVWDRAAATEALNTFETLYGIPRRSVRFDVR